MVSVNCFSSSWRGAEVAEQPPINSRANNRAHNREQDNGPARLVARQGRLVCGLMVAPPPNDSSKRCQVMAISSSASSKWRTRPVLDFQGSPAGQNRDQLFAHPGGRTRLQQSRCFQIGDAVKTSPQQVDHVVGLDQIPRRNTVLAGHQIQETAQNRNRGGFVLVGL